MQLLATVLEFDPHLTVNTQQTPKPAAQFPSAEAPEPDLAAHSVAVMHVPFSVGSVDGVHVSCCKFGQQPLQLVDIEYTEARQTNTLAQVIENVSE